MRHFNFETNIQERMPWNGKVFFVKRMTADYAECYPFDVDGFIEDVYQKYQQMAAEDPTLAAWAKPREELRRQWVKTLSVTRPSGDATIYPNRDGRQEPALMEVWHKAGDFWRAGLRIGDTLPQIVPPCRITRLEEGGWIALFPKEMHLLDEPALPKTDGGVDAADDFGDDLESAPLIDAMAHDAASASEAEPAGLGSEETVLADDTDGDGQRCDTDLTCEASPLGVCEAQAMELDTTETIATAASGHGVTPAPEPFVTAEPAPGYRRSKRDVMIGRRHQRRLERERMQRSYEDRIEREAREAEEYAREQEHRKIFAAVGAVAVTAVLIYFFGLLGPAVFGLLCGGLLKG